MDDLMARTMVENLSMGIDPITGRALSSKDCCSNSIVQEAIKTILENCTIESYASMLRRQREEKAAEKEARAEERRIRYPNQGKKWTRDEEIQLRQMFMRRYSIIQMANTLKRTPGAISDHLRKMKLIK